MNPKSTPPPHGAIECFGNFHGPEVLILVGHGEDRATFHLAECYLHHLGDRWTALRGIQVNSPLRRLSRGVCHGRVSRRPFHILPSFGRNPKILNLKGECPDAIRIILQIATHEYTKVPKRLDFSKIVHLAEVAARWECHKMLVNFMEKWIAPYRDMLFEPEYEQWLYIAHEFGYEQEYLNLSRYLAIHCSVDSQDRLVALDGALLEDRGAYPFNTLLHIKEARRQILQSMLKSLYDLWATVASGSNCLLVDDTNDYGLRSCAGINLIDFTEYLRGQNLFPMIKNVEPIRYSAYSMARRVHSELPLCPVDLESRGSAVPNPLPPHVECHITYQLGPIMQRILDIARWPVDMPLVEQIRQNASECQSEPTDDNSCADKHFSRIEIISSKRFTNLTGSKDGNDAIAKGLQVGGTPVQGSPGGTNAEGVKEIDTLPSACPNFFSVVTRWWRVQVKNEIPLTGHSPPGQET